MIHVITGHICAGKSTHVRNHARRGDVVVDMDRIALAFSHEDTQHHDYPRHIIDVARAARWAAMDEAIRQHKSGGFDVWIIHAYPEDKDWTTYRRIGAAVLEVQCDADELVARASRERPERMRRELARRLPQNATGG